MNSAETVQRRQSEVEQRKSVNPSIRQKMGPEGQEEALGWLGWNAVNGGRGECGSVNVGVGGKKTTKKKTVEVEVKEDEEMKRRGTVDEKQS